MARRLWAWVLPIFGTGVIRFDKGRVVPESFSHADAMYGTMLRTITGGTVWGCSNLLPGNYSLYVFAHGPYRADNVSTISVYKNSENLGTKGPLSSTNWNSTLFQENIHYVRYSGLSLSSRDILYFNWDGWLNGVQIVKEF
jgi:hypothetical protein